MKVWVLTRSYWENPCKDFKGVWKERPSAEELTKIVLNSFIAEKVSTEGKYCKSVEDQFWYLDEAEVK